MLAVNPGIDNQRHDQNAKHHAERNGDRDMVEIDDQHLDTDKHQDHRQAVLQHGEALRRARQQEVHRAQAEDGEQVRGQHDERVGGHRENGRNAVHGENHVAQLNQNQHQQQRGGKQQAVLAHEEVLALDLVGHAQMAADPLHQRAIANRGAVLFRQRHFDPGEQQERAEDVQQPFELGNQPAASEDHDGTQDNCAQHAVHQHATLQSRRHGEVAEQHQPDEDVINRQGFFNQIAGEEGERLRIGHRAAFGRGQIPPEGGAEEQGESNPDQRPGGGLFHGHAVRAATALQKEVDRQHDEHDNRESAPQHWSADRMHTIFLTHKKQKRPWSEDDSR